MGTAEMPPERAGLVTRKGVAVALVLGLLGASLLAGRASAASIVEVTSFGSNPGNLQMFKYVPDGLGSGKPLVIVMHGCTQSGSAMATDSGWTTVADRFGFALAIPQQKSANNGATCFNWFEPGDIARGSGEALSIK